MTCRVPILCDRHGHPLHFHLTPGQTHEASVFDTLMVGADAELIDEDMLDLEITPVIHSKSNQDREAREVEFDREGYRDRNIVERLIGWLKKCRRIFSRFEKIAKNFGGMIRMAFIQRYLRLPFNDFSDEA